MNSSTDKGTSVKIVLPLQSQQYENK